MKIIAFVPARGGSKSIPLKNIKDFCGRPLIYWNLLALSNAPSIDSIVVATDSDIISGTVGGFNLPKVSIYRRNAENAADHSSTESVMLEYLESLENIHTDGLFILSQLTNPFTTSEDYEKGIQYILSGERDSVLSASLIKRFFWTTQGKTINYDYQNRPRRQDFDGCFIENGAFYINDVGNILKDRNRISGNIGIVEMPEYTQTEIDEPHDWIICEQLFRHYHAQQVEISKRQQIPNIKLVISDVDGVLTDAGMYYGENGDELKKFNTRDGMGFELLRRAGYLTGIITSENTAIVERRAKKLKVDYLYQGKREGGKLEAIQEICTQTGIQLSEVAYIGDDINCLNALQAVGLAACPADANFKIKELSNVILLSSKGGEGCFREFVEYILSK